MRKESRTRKTSLQEQAHLLPVHRPAWAHERDWDIAWRHLREDQTLAQIADDYGLGQQRIREVIHIVLTRAARQLREQEAIVQVRMLLLAAHDETIGCLCRFCRTVPLDGRHRRWSCPDCGYAGMPIGHPCTCQDRACEGKRLWQRREGCKHGEPLCPCCGDGGGTINAWRLIREIRGLVEPS